MNAERLLKHYERIADAPDAIARLRRFILDLAVRGKLVPQDANDEPIAKRYQKELGGDDLPASWRLLNFGKFCDIEGGNQPPKSQFIDEPKQGYVRLLQIRDLGDCPVPTYIPIASARSLCKQGEILIGRYGASVGKVFWAQDGAYNVAMAKFIWPDDALIARFVFLLLKSEYLQGPLARATRSAQAGFNKGDVAPIDFPLPPLAEQHRIVAKVDALMTLCDRLEAARASREVVRDRLAAASLARLNAPDPETFQADARFALDALPALTTRPDQIKALRQTILNLAVRGKVVPQDAKEEPASKLLERIAKEKARLVKVGEIKKAEAVADLSASATDFSTPHGWAITNLQSICNSVTDGDHLPPPKAETGIPFLVIGNVRSRRISFEGSRFVPQTYYDALDPIRRPRSGDLLYTLVGSYGIPVIVLDDRPFCVQRHIGILRPSELIDVNFLALMMESSLAFDQATICATGIAQKTVPLSGLRRLVLPLPPRAEQHRIVAKVDELMALCDRLEASLTATAATRRRLLDGLLTEALAPTDDRELEAAE